MSIKDNFLNEVDITSKIRSKGEYKYYYCGENNSESDKSFLAISSMWFNEKVTSDMEIISSCYNNVNTAQIFLNNKTNKYNIFIYKNIIDYRNENMKLKLLHRINISANLNVEMNNKTITVDKKKLKIFLTGKNYLIINIIDFNILLLDFTTGNFITIFLRTFGDKETLFNVIDTYDEPYMVDGEQKIRTYVFLSKKDQERKTAIYSYKYFIILNDAFKLKNILLHSLDFDLGNAEPLGLKIGKIFMPESNWTKFCFIFIFISSKTLFQLITDYDNINLHNMLKKNSRAENNNKENEENENNINNKLDNDIDKESNNINLDKNKFNIDNNEIKTKYWTIKRKIESEKKNIVQSIKSILNINDKRICSFVLFFESKNIISFNFNYTDSPEEIRDKIFVKSNINLSSESNNFEKYFKPQAKIYKYIDLYMFKNGSFFNYSRNNLILCDKTKMHIYSEESDLPIYTYEFYQEDLSCFITIEGMGSTFLLSGNKLFKIIFNQRYNLFSDEKIIKNNNIEINYFKTNKKLSYPIFEFQPENIWNSYCVSLGLEKIDFKEEEEEIINNNEDNDSNKKEIITSSKKNKRINTKNVNFDKFCVLCGKKSDKCCSDCNIRFYCCEEHFKYDYYSYHFFECQWIQFFSRKDIMNIKDKEIRYKILYNELIKVCGRILTFIFMRIYCKNDYQYFLNMILVNIRILENFGFKMNLSEFCNCNYTLNEKIINRFQKIIFYQEALFFYVQLNFLKCTFTLKSGLYNLTDCYLKIINSDIIPLLTPKMNKRLISLKCDKINSDILYNNPYFNEFDSELFFDIEKFIKNNSAPNNLIDLVEDYITKHIFSLSLLFKFKSKIDSSIEVQDAFVNINLMFDDHFSEMEKKIASYCYFFISFYLVEIGKIPQTIKLLKRMISVFVKLDNDNNILKYLTYYNLGILQYALGNFDIGIHNIETAYKLSVENNFSDKIKIKIIDTLGLAYLNRRNLYKAFLLIKKSIQERKKLNKKNDEIDCTKLNVYLNYINDLYEYTFISKARLLIKKKNKNDDRKELMKFVLGEEDKELVISEQNISDVIKVAKFIWELREDVLRQLNIDNPPKNINVNNNKEEHHDKNISFNSEISSNLTTTFIYKENLEKEEAEEDYEDDIEIKTSLYDNDNLLSRKQKQDFKELKTTFLKRNIILRDSLGDIEKFNINYEPIFAAEFEKNIEKLKSNFLLKEIFYCFQNEKWRDELYNYNQNDILFGLSKYLKMEKIKNMLAIEKTKILEALKQKKLMQKEKINNNFIDVNKSNMLIDYKNQVAINEVDNYCVEKSGKNEIEISNDISSKSSSSLISKEKEENNIGIKYNNKIKYRQFKAKFIEALKELENDKNNQDLYEFLDFDENYLYNLYVNVFKNNPDNEFIFQNPLLILNYIFIEINKVPEIEIKKVDLEPETIPLKEEEKKSQLEKSEEIKNIEGKKENEEKEEKEVSSSSYDLNNNNLEENSNSNKEIENKSNEEENKKDDNKEKEEKEKEKEENNKDKEEKNIKYELNITNSLMEKFEREENIYDYTRDEINKSKEISLEYIMKKYETIQSKRLSIKSLPNEGKKNWASIVVKNKRKSEIKNILFLPFFQDKNQVEHHKTLIQEADKYLLTSKENSKIENEKTFQKIQKHNRQPTHIDVPKLNLDEIKNKKEEEKNDINSNKIKNKYINYMPFINKTKKSSRRISLKKSSNKSDKEEKAENEEYFDLKKEMALNDIKTKKKKRREHNFSTNILEKGNMKQKNKKNNYGVSDSFEKILNDKNKNKNKSVKEYKSKSIKKTKAKNASFKFKNKEEKEKELEAGALLYLQNENNFKKNNMIMNINNSVLYGKSNRNKNNIIVKNRIFKSTDEKRVNIYNKNKIEIGGDKNVFIKPENRNKKKLRQNRIKINSSTTLNSTSIEFDDIRAKKSPKKNKIKINNNNKSPSKNKKVNKKGNIFEEEYRKIIEFNKRKKINLDNNDYQYDIKNLYSDIKNRLGKNILYNATSPSGNEDFIKNNNPRTGDRKLFANNYYKKSNFIPTTNYTNSESPGNTRLITFQGKGNNNNKTNVRAWSKDKSKDY